MSKTPEINRLLPQAPDAEMGLLCSMLLDPSNVCAMCAERQIGRNHFHTAANAVVFDALMKGWGKSEPLDAITLTNALRATGNLEAVGGPAAVIGLSMYLPTAVNAPTYADICEEKRLARGLISLCTEYRERAWSEKEAPSGLVEKIAETLNKISSAQASTKKPPEPKEIAADAISRAEDRMEKRGLADYTMRTGIEKLDDAMSGMRAGDFILISGKEKSGKTSLAFNILEHVVFEQGKRAVVASLEMKIPEIADRMISTLGRINFTKILNGWMDEGELRNFGMASSKLSTGRFQIRDDVYGLQQIVAAFRQYKATYPDLELGIVDYLQLVDGEKVDKDDSREQIIARTSRTLRRLASELNIAMLLLVQLNEDGAVRESRAPGMDCTAHIRIEPGAEEGIKWARIVYQRNGPSNVGVPLAHLGQFLKFEQAAGEHEPPEAQPKKKARYQN